MLVRLLRITLLLAGIIAAIKTIFRLRIGISTARKLTRFRLHSIESLTVAEVSQQDRRLYLAHQRHGKLFYRAVIVGVVLFIMAVGVVVYLTVMNQSRDRVIFGGAGLFIIAGIVTVRIQRRTLLTRQSEIRRYLKTDSANTLKVQEYPPALLQPYSKAIQMASRWGLLAAASCLFYAYLCALK